MKQHWQKDDYCHDLFMPIWKISLLSQVRTIKIKNSVTMNILLLFLEYQFYWAGKKTLSTRQLGQWRELKICAFSPLWGKLLFSNWNTIVSLRLPTQYIDMWAGVWVGLFGPTIGKLLPFQRESQRIRQPLKRNSKDIEVNRQKIRSGCSGRHALDSSIRSWASYEFGNKSWNQSWVV